MPVELDSPKRARLTATLSRVRLHGSCKGAIWDKAHCRFRIIKKSQGRPLSKYIPWKGVRGASTMEAFQASLADVTEVVFTYLNDPSDDPAAPAPPADGDDGGETGPVGDS